MTFKRCIRPSSFSQEGWEQQHPKSTSSPQTPWLPNTVLLEATAHSRASAEKVQDKLGTSWAARKQRCTHRMMGTGHRDITASLKGLPLAKLEAMWASEWIIILTEPNPSKFNSKLLTYKYRETFQRGSLAKTTFIKASVIISSHGTNC